MFLNQMATCYITTDGGSRTYRDRALAFFIFLIELIIKQLWPWANLKLLY